MLVNAVFFSTIIVIHTDACIIRLQTTNHFYLTSYEKRKVLQRRWHCNAIGRKICQNKNHRWVKYQAKKVRKEFGKVVKKKSREVVRRSPRRSRWSSAPMANWGQVTKRCRARRSLQKKARKSSAKKSSKKRARKEELEKEELEKEEPEEARRKSSREEELGEKVRRNQQIRGMRSLKIMQVNTKYGQISKDSHARSRAPMAIRKEEQIKRYSQDTETA